MILKNDSILSKRLITFSFAPLVLGAMLLASPVSTASAAEPAQKGKLTADLRLRYETVSQDNALQDADALTLRTHLGYKTASYEGFSAVIEVENVLEIIDDFSVPPAGIRPGQYSVVADPEGTELDQAFVQYKANGVDLKVGRQVIALDGHRFVGHVGWRQDRQTFDGAFVTYSPTDKLAVNASYIVKRNRIFAEEGDIDSNDTLLNVAYATPYGKLVAYALLLEMDIESNNGLDTYGLNFKGAQAFGDQKVVYQAEYATQEIDNTFDTDYLLIEGGLVAKGITAMIGYEVLGSDEGQRGFATPLATLHKFNGWSDQFLSTPNQGLQDLYLTVSGKLAGGVWVASLHDFSADVDLAGNDDLGDELNLLYSRKFSDRYSAGIKLADYSAGDAAFNKVDTDKFWVWVGAKF